MCSSVYLRREFRHSRTSPPPAPKDRAFVCSKAGKCRTGPSSANGRWDIKAGECISATTTSCALARRRPCTLEGDPPSELSPWSFQCAFPLV
jgi:hypothetical protein